MIKKLLFPLVMFAFLGIKSQNNTGAIKVTIKDKTTGETLPFASVVAYSKGVQVAGTTTDMNGECFLKPLPPGTYEVKAVYVGYQPKELKGILV
ncbi:MAG: carboxypeptidase-like regulatory domain-containing protein, partial [Bacteroidia bacterium]|nr:carboxypeptidase-like regulatory domain-containing protein [Bacteroidia bacterium]